MNSRQKLITLVLLFSSNFFFIFANAQSPSIPAPYLGPGSEQTVGSQTVLDFQNYLKNLGYLTQEQIDTGPGIYGPQTTAAVAALQQHLGVNCGSYCGYYGPQTQIALQNADPNSIAKNTPSSSPTSLPNPPVVARTVPGGVNPGSNPNPTASPTPTPSPTPTATPNQNHSNTSNTSSCFVPNILPNQPSFTFTGMITFYSPKSGGGTGNTKAGFALADFLFSKDLKSSSFSPNYPYPCHQAGMAAVDPSFIPFGSLIRVSVRDGDTGPVIGNYYYEAGDIGPDVISRRAPRERNFKNQPAPKYIPSRCTNYEICQYLPVVDLYVPERISSSYKTTITVYPCFFPLSGRSCNKNDWRI